MSQVPPVVRYLILCDDAQTDKDAPGRFSIAGMMVGLVSDARPKYPFVYQELCVFALLTGCRGPAECRIEIQHADTQQAIFRTQTRNVPFGNNPLGFFGCIFRIRNCAFPEAGLYWVQLWYNEQMIEQQPLLLG